MLSGLTILIPAFNEALSIESAVRAVLDNLPPALQNFEIIVINDNSTDATGAIVRKLVANDERIRLIEHDRNKGKGAALRTGFRHNRMDRFLFMDADLQIDIAELPAFLEQGQEYDVVIGYRIGRKNPLIRRLLSKSYGLIVPRLLDFRVRDLGCPFKLFKASSFSGINLVSNGLIIDAELLFRLTRKGCRIKELPVCSHPRQQGRSTIRFRHFVEAIRELYAILRNR